MLYILFIKFINRYNEDRENVLRIEQKGEGGGGEI
jgi:hypothetical protein